MKMVTDMLKDLVAAGVQVHILTRNSKHVVDKVLSPTITLRIHHYTIQHQTTHAYLFLFAMGRRWRALVVLRTWLPAWSATKRMGGRRPNHWQSRSISWVAIKRRI